MIKLQFFESGISLWLWHCMLITFCWTFCVQQKPCRIVLARPEHLGLCPYHLRLALFPGYNIKEHPTCRGMAPPGSVAQDTPNDHNSSPKGLQGNADHQAMTPIASQTGMKSVVLSRTCTSGFGYSLRHEAKVKVWVGMGVSLGRELVRGLFWVKQQQCVATRTLLAVSLHLVMFGCDPNPCVGSWSPLHRWQVQAPVGGSEFACHEFSADQLPPPPSPNTSFSMTSS